ncbi:helix-turn-helix domain-containing protein [bacterium]|nr:helix-turn-helix domain-containing protein [bacterium]
MIIPTKLRPDMPPSYVSLSSSGMGHRMTVVPDNLIDPDPTSALLEHLQLRCQTTHENSLSPEANIVECSDLQPLFHYVVAGSCLFEDAQTTLPLEAGDLLLQFEGTPHRLQVSDKGSPGMGIADSSGRNYDCVQVLTGRIHAAGNDWTLLQNSLPSRIVLRRDDPHRQGISQILQNVSEELKDEQAGSWVIVNHLFTLVLMHLARHALQGNPPELSNWLRGLRDAELGPIMSRMLRQPEWPWTIASLAESGQLARSTFARRFRQVVGEAPMDVLTTIRMRIACELLQSDLGLKELSRRVGYRSVSAFSVAFRRKYQSSPWQYRQHVQASSLPRR